MNSQGNSYQKIAEEFLKEKSNFFLPRLWNVVRWLQAERDLEGKDEFSIPIYRFKKQKIDLDEARKIITQLEDRGFLTTFKKLGGTPPGPPMQASVGVNLSEDKLIFSDPNTKLTLLHPFKYLYELLYDKYSKTDGKQIDTTKLEEKAEVIISSFSQHNLLFVSEVLTRIADSIEFAPGKKAEYKLQSPSGTGLLIAERQLLKKLESFGLFKKGFEDGIFGISPITDWNLSLIRECVSRIKSKLVSSEIYQNRGYSVKQWVKEVKDNKQQSDSQIQDKPTSKRELRKMITNIIRNSKFGKKERAFLSLLAKDFEPKTIEEISKEISTKACKTLKARVYKKIKNTGFSIHTIKPDKWGGKPQYQLRYLTSSASL